MPKIFCATAALACTLAYIRPDELNTISSSFLYYEYIFFSGSLLYLWSYIRCLESGRHIFYLAMLSLSIFLFDVAGFIAIISSAVHGILSLIKSRFNVRKPAYFIPTICLGGLYISKKIFFYTSISDGRLVPEQLQIFDSARYFIQSFGQSVVNIKVIERILISMRLNDELGSSINLVIGSVVAISILISLLFLLQNVNAIDDFKGAFLLIIFGLISILGTFITRASLSPDQAFAPRYVRYISFVLFFLVPIIYSSAKKISFSNRQAQCIIMFSGFLILFRTSLLGFFYSEPVAPHILNYYKNYRSHISEYKLSDYDSFVPIKPYMHYKCRDYGVTDPQCHEITDYIFQRQSQTDQGHFIQRQP